MRASRTGFGLRASNNIWHSPFVNWRARSAKQNTDPRNYKPNAALQIAPVLGAVQILARSVAAAGLTIQRKKGKIWEAIEDDLPKWADPEYRPNQYQNRYEMFYNLMMNYLVGGNGYELVLSKKDGFPDQMISVPGGITSIHFAGQEISALDRRVPLTPGDKLMYNIDGETYKPYTSLTPDGDVIHFKMISGPSTIYGQSPLMLGAPAMRSALAVEAHAELAFQTGGMPPGILIGETKDSLNAENKENMKMHWKRTRNNPEERFVPMVLSGPWQYISTYVNPDQMQLIDARKFNFQAAAAMYGVPPPLIGDTTITSWGQGIRQLVRLFVQFSLSPLLIHVGGMLTEALPNGVRAVMLPDHLLDAEPLEQARYLERLVLSGIILPSEAREDLGHPEMAGIDERPLPQRTPSGGGDSDSGKDDGRENNVEDMA